LVEQRKAVFPHLQIDQHAGDRLIELAVVHALESLAQCFGVARGRVGTWSASAVERILVAKIRSVQQ